jgi:type I restriction enzyme R subunit
LFSNKDASSTVLVKPFEEYFGDYQDAVDRLLTLTPTVESVDIYRMKKHNWLL